MKLNKNRQRIACIIPTYFGGNDFVRLLDSLRAQTISYDLLVVDSSSGDSTFQLAQKDATHCYSIPVNEFNHGATRQDVVNKYPDYDIYIFLTQDVFFEKPESLSRLVTYFDDPEVGAVCGRQLPHSNANPLATHARYFNYPAESKIKSLSDASNLGLKTVFLSNSFAAYRSGALQQAGGFPPHVILAEDMYVAAKMIKQGWKIAYAGDSCCYHSHNYTPWEEFKRYFDTGVFHAREPWIRQSFGAAGGEGVRYVISELKFLGLTNIFWWPQSLLSNGFKLLGYKLGKSEKLLPLFMKKKLSMHYRYWT